MMSEKKKNIKIVRLGVWTDSCFDQTIRESLSIDVEVLDLTASDQENWSVLSHADIYHISSAVDEVPTQWLVSPELLEKCPNLACVSTSGAGYDTVDVAACTRAGVLVLNQAGGNANSVAEHAFGLMLALMRRIPESGQRLREGSVKAREDLMGNELAGKTLGLIGFGHIGKRTGQIAAAFDMRVLVHDPYLSAEEIIRFGGQPIALDALVAVSDIISIHCPKTQETHHLFDAQRFGAMKRGALFISTARGGIHNERDLYQSLITGHLKGAGLDVWSVEPPDPTHDLLRLPNVVATYHTGGVTYEGRRNVARMAAQQIVAVCSGNPAMNMVNAEVLNKSLGRLTINNI